MRLNKENLIFLEEIYNQGYFRIYMGVPNPEEKLRIKEYLLSLNLIYQVSNTTYKLTPKGTFLLSEYGIAVQPVSTLKNFLTNYEGKINWNRPELIQYQKANNISNDDMERALTLGRDLNYLRCNWGSNYLPYEVEITLLGEEYIKSPELFIKSIRLDERNFKNSFQDLTIIKWLKSTSNETEDFEAEFKLNTPPNVKLKEIFSGFANSQSGVLAIGFNDNGKLIGLDDPDKEERRIFNVKSMMENIDIKTRVIKNDDGLRGLIVMIARGDRPILIGETVKIRDGSSFRPAKPSEIINLTLDMKKSQGGHLWIKSLRTFQNQDQEEIF